MTTIDIHEQCGIFGVYNHPNAAEMTYLGLYALQHRGQESSGIAVSDRQKLTTQKGMGLVSQVFGQDGRLAGLQGVHAIGHNRYSTTGSSTIVNAQPILIDFKSGQIAGAHNGNLTNALALRRQMEKDGSIFMSTTDTEVIMHLLARSRRSTIEKMILESLSQVHGAYSMLFLTPTALYGVRDPRGVRPLILGKLGGSWLLSSETCAFDLVGASIEREIEPGEMVKIDEKGVTSYTVPLFERIKNHAHCIFEYIYFSRPDSFAFGHNVDKIRRKFGRQLALSHPCPGADVVIGIPDSATTAALGYSQESGIRYDIGLIRNHYVGRTFIHPVQSGRDLNVRIKFNPVKGVIKGRNVVLVDDSIVRGTTMKKLVTLVKTAEPASIHLRVSSPPIICPCFFGIDMPTKEELIASSKETEEIRMYLGVDSLGYLSIDSMLSVLKPEERPNFCTACFNGSYFTEPLT
ncbi:MAG: amidophosphoribosyltransferase [Chitinispirillaceae bacterium]|nr:amidophosphoribosyltransferase [Chitinispirillaceae bacterium]